MGWRIGIDTGGTFTDLVGINSQDGRLHCLKVHSTPGDPGEALCRGILQFCSRHGVDPAAIDLLIHGSTVATNAVLERKGARTAFLTTAGFRDVLIIQRQNRPRLYDLRSRRPMPVVPRSLIFEAAERILSDGRIETPLREENLAGVIGRLRGEKIESIAIGFLNSYVNPDHEIQAREILRRHLPGVDVGVSHEVVRSQGEYERFSTCAINSYVQPKMQGYLNRLREKLAGKGLPPDLFIMKSNGGMTSAQLAGEKSVETLLSGPTGGVMAGARLAADCGRRNLITADVGGTSFDVALIHGGRPSYVSQSQIDGLPINLPMVDIHSIGAGGGSIGWIDPGGALRVGPQSAGAAPGPVCYGTGGTEPTVTDANLILGRIAAQSSLAGGMELDLAAARQAIQTRLASRLALSVEETAEGMIRVINARMTAAIRKLTVERGLDPKPFSLCIFGGAGPLHGAELAEEMNMGEVIVPVIPGGFSAYGLLISEMREEQIQTWLKLLEETDMLQLENRFAELERETAAGLHRHLPGEKSHRVIRRLQLRYHGQSHSLPVDLPAGKVQKAKVAGLFHQAHRQAYGYAFEEEGVEIVNLWTVVILDIEQPAASPYRVSPPAAPRGTRPVYLEGRWWQTSVHDRFGLAAGAKLTGPAIIEQSDTTTLLLPRQSAEVDPFGNLILKSRQPDIAASPRQIMTDSSINPIQLEIMRNRWRGIAEEVCAAMIRASYSPNIRNRFDCSAALALPNGEIIAQAEVGTPLHLGIMPGVISSVLSQIPIGQIEDGDAIITNLPYPEGPGHLPDLSMVSAVYHAGRPVLLAITTCHHVDMGGYAPGSMPFGVTEIFQEGLQIPPVKLFARGVMNQAIFSIIQQNVRTLRELKGDLMAQWAAACTATARVRELYRQAPEAEIARYLLAILDHAEASMRAGLRQLPEGEYAFEDFLDDDGASDTAVRIRVKLTIRGDRLTADFAGTSAQVAGPLNARLSAARACVYYAVKAVVDPDLPSCSGAYRPITVLAPEGSLLQARYPAAIGNANILTDQRVVDVLLGALYQCVPHQVCAACSSEMNLTNIGGTDPATGEYFNFVETYGGGTGALHDLDGEDAIQNHLTNTQNTPIEVVDRNYPLRVIGYRLVEDSCGAGRQRGGCGLAREFLFLGDRAIMTLGSDRRRFTPWGLDGGKNGRGAHSYLIAPDGTEKELPTKTCVTLRRGDRIRIETPGGGGWGDPRERPAAAIKADLENGYISAAYARTHFNS